LIAVAALILSGGGVAYVLSRLEAALPTPVDGIAQLDATTTRLIQTIPTGTRGGQIAVGEGYAWQISYTGRTLKRIDPHSQQVTTYGITNGAPPVGIAIGDHAVWVATAYGSKSVFRFDPKTQLFGAPIEVASGLQGIAFGANAVWVTDKNDNAVYRINPLTERVTARIPVGDGPEPIAVSGNTVWVGNGVDRTLSRIDGNSSAVVATISLRGAPTAIAAGHAAVWVASDPAQLVTRVTPATDATLEIPLGAAPSDITIGAGAVWASKGVAGGVARIDPDSARVSTVSLKGVAEGIASDGSTVWVSAHTQATPTAVAPSQLATRGGTLRVVIPGWSISDLANPDPRPSALDPQLANGLDSAELLRCCLVRTLFTHPGRPSQDGGADLYPDLAQGWPQVSADGRVWTFAIRPGMKYAPPMENSDITSADIVRALMRDARFGGNRGDVYSVIEGFDAYRTQNATTIAGLSTPDRYTLTVRLNQPAGDLAARFALTQSAPIPPRPGDVAEPLGMASGHDAGYGPFLVASGPYMISNFRLGSSLTLVRNPSWNREMDPVRPAFVDRIEFVIGVSDAEAARLLESGKADLIMRASPPPQLAPSLLQSVQSDPSLGHIDLQSRDFLRTVMMNLAVPPFDDVHVRRAVNYVINKRALTNAHGGDLAGAVATHYVPDSLEAGALSNYDPYATDEGAGSLELASREMKLSRYDPQQSGRCSVPICAHVLAVARKGATGPFPELGGFPTLGRMIAADLSQLGINVDLVVGMPSPTNPEKRVAIYLTEGLTPSFLSASSTFPSDLSGPRNEALLGATPEQLRARGYSVSDVPTVDARITECMSMFGDARSAECWTALDVYVMEQVVPIAPYTRENVAEVVPPRVTRYSYDQSSDSPALDQIAVKPLLTSQ
jgi:YVTN family beta-propeller protein